MRTSSPKKSKRNLLTALDTCQTSWLKVRGSQAHTVGDRCPEVLDLEDISVEVWFSADGNIVKRKLQKENTSIAKHIQYLAHV